MDLAQVRQDIADLLVGVGILRVFATIPDQLLGPCAVIYPESVSYLDTYDETNNSTLIIQLLAPAVSAASTQGELDGWLSTGTADSVPDALEPDGRFRPVEMRNYGTISQNDGGSRYFTAEIVVDALI